MACSNASIIVTITLRHALRLVERLYYSLNNHSSYAGVNARDNYADARTLTERKLLQLSNTVTCGAVASSHIRSGIGS